MERGADLAACNSVGALRTGVAPRRALRRSHAGGTHTIPRGHQRGCQHDEAAVPGRYRGAGRGECPRRCTLKRNDIGLALRLSCPLWACLRWWRPSWSLNERNELLRYFIGVSRARPSSKVMPQQRPTGALLTDQGVVAMKASARHWSQCRRTHGWAIAGGCDSARGADVSPRSLPPDTGTVLQTRCSGGQRRTQGPDSRGHPRAPIVVVRDAGSVVLEFVPALGQRAGGAAARRHGREHAVLAVVQPAERPRELARGDRQRAAAFVRPSDVRRRSRGGGSVVGAHSRFL
jgi:hypothetical protein